MKSVSLKVHSHKTGIAFASDKQGAITLVVLPKIWREGNEAFRIQWKRHQAVFTLFENQTVQIDIEGSPEEITQRYRLLQELIRQSQEEVKGKKFREGQNNGALITEIGTIKTSTYIEPTNEDESLGVQSILSLLLLIHHTKIKQNDDVLIKKLQDYLLTPLTHLRYLQEVEKVLRAFRRGYVPQSETLQVIRGRVDVRSVAKNEEMNSNQLLCHYDEFTKGTPLMRVLTAALEVVASGNWLSFRKQHASDNFGVDIRNRGAKYRRYLSSIVAYPRDTALYEARNIRLNRIDKQFQPTLELAKMVLENTQNIFSRQGKFQSNSWCWSVVMSDVWEDILVQGFSRALHPENVVHYEAWVADRSMKNDVFQHIVPAPFVGGSPRRPDIMLKNGEQNWIVDAKYSLKNKERDQHLEAPRAYQFQMFIYASLTSENGEHRWANELALIYPAQEHFIFYKSPHMSGLSDNTKLMPRLFQVACSFPHRNIFTVHSCKKERSDATKIWNQYVAQLAEELREFLTLCREPE